MDRLSGLDAAFLYLETPSLHMHVSLAAIFDPSTVPGGYSFEKMRGFIASRIPLAPLFRRKIAEVPFRMGHPYWVDDPDFDLDFHVRRAALPHPGSIENLAEFASDVNSRQLDRSKPLWQMYFVEGLQDGRIAIVSKIHHCTIDGVSGAELMTHLFDLEAAPPPKEIPEQGPPEKLPSDRDLIAQALIQRLTKPLAVTRLAWATGKSVLEVRRLRQQADSSSGKAALPLTAPRTSLNAALTPHRKIAFSSIALDDVKRLKNHLGCTVNDVVLALCTRALRSYLIAGNELPEHALVATVPVSVHQHGEDIAGINKVSGMFVGLPTFEPDPLRTVEVIKAGTRGAKEEHSALGADKLLNWAQHASPNVFSAAVRTYTRLKLSDRHRPVQNLVISNVPGPDFPLYFGGAEMVAGFPLGPAMEGAALNVTVMSYRGVLNWGLVVGAEAVPRVWEIADAVPEALDELLAAAGLDPALPMGVTMHRRARASGRRRTTQSASGSRGGPGGSGERRTSRPAPSSPSGAPAPVRKVPPRKAASKTPSSGK